MAKEQILTEYQVTVKGGDKVVSTITNITEEWEKSEKAATAALSEKQIDSATAKLSKFNTEVEKTASGFTSAKSELRELEKVITSGKLQGNDLKQAVAQAAKLKDRIGDVREEIGRLSSDTRVFDSFVEGGRGIAAAFSVAAGASALFGKESENLTKAIAKAQGALALLTGAQELANIVTKQGGIATQAYGVAMQVVDKIAKVTGASIATSMAIATAGVTVLLGAAAALVVYFTNASDASEDLQRKEEERLAAQAKSDAVRKLIQENTSKANQLQFEQEKLRAKNREQEANAEISYNQRIADSLAPKVKALTGLVGAFKESEKGSEAYRQAEGALLDTQLAYTSVLSNIKKLEGDLAKERQDESKRIKQEATDNLESFKLPDKDKADFTVKELTITPEAVVMEKVPEVTVPVTLQPKSPEETFTEFINESVSYLEGVKPLVGALSGFTSAFFQAESSSLAAEKEKQLALVGDNLKKREAIEKQFAIKQAQLARKQAIANKIFSAFDIVLNTAQGISKTIATSGFPAAIPLIALAAAAGALQLAAVAAQPLPEIPKFKKGVIGFKGKGTETSDENLVMISNNESVMTGKATTKYKDELQAAQDLQLEDLIYHKYLLPALKQAGAADKEGNLYDDWNLRRTIKQGQHADRENSKYIVNGILSGMRENNYNTQRYLS